MENKRFENLEPGDNNNGENDEGPEIEPLTPENADRLLVGEWELRLVSDIKPGDIIVQFGRKIKVLEVIPKGKNKFDFVVEGKEGNRPRWENLGGDSGFRILISEKPESEKKEQEEK